MPATIRKSAPRADEPLWNADAERLSGEALRALQLDRLKRQVAYNAANSEFYRKKFAAAGAEPGDMRSFADFARLPPV